MPSKSSSEEKEPGKSFWVRADLPPSWRERNRFETSAVEAKADLLVVKIEDLDRVKKLGAKRIGVIAGQDIDVPQDVVLIDPSPKATGSRDGVALISIASGDDQDRAVGLTGSYDTIVVNCKDWRVIPLENLVAACQRTGCQLFAVVSSPADAKTALGVLQKGVDGVMLEAGSVDDIVETGAVIRPKRPSLRLVEAEVTSVRPVGNGDRACIDTCSLLEEGEGLLIGSQADGLALVHGETISTEYVEARPFRVNAGAIHSYVLHVDNKTRYLSDLRAGDPVLIVGADGSTRVVTVGRVKIETRPLSMVELKHDKRAFKVILQDAETIRLVGPKGEALSVKDLKQGDHILSYVSGEARHFGMAIEEKLIER